MQADSIDPNVALFIKKTYDILENPKYSQIIHWLPSGREFAIKDPDTLQSDILPIFFRHRNIHSFIRQLNMYDFHKSRKDPSRNIFSHPNFQKGREDLLQSVKRKLKNEEKHQEHHPTEESRSTMKHSTQHVLQPILDENNQNYPQPELQKKDSSDKCQIQQQPSITQLIMQSMICPSEVRNVSKPDIYSQLYANVRDDDESSSSEDENLSIQGEIEKEREVYRNRMSGVSLVHTHNLLQTQNNLSDPDI